MIWNELFKPYNNVYAYTAYLNPFYTNYLELQYVIAMLAAKCSPWFLLQLLFSSKTCLAVREHINNIMTIKQMQGNIFR